MLTSQLRANAREYLTGKWGKAALLTLVFVLITFVICFLLNFIPVVGPILLFVIELPISYGFLVTFIKLKRDEEVTYTEFLSVAFSSVGRVWGTVGNIILKMIIPFCLVIVSLLVMIFGFSGSIISFSYLSASSAGLAGLGIIGFIAYIASLIYTIVKGYLYSLSFYILYDNPEMPTKEVVEESERLMQGNRWRFFYLGLTFIGWAILSVFTLYIGFFWLYPYIMVAFVCFYEALKDEQKTVKPDDNNPEVISE